MIRHTIRTPGAAHAEHHYIIILILLLLGALPSWPYSRGFGYYPSGILGVVLIIVIILVLTNRL